MLCSLSALLLMSLPAFAEPPPGVQELWSAYLTRSDAFDPSIVELYAPGAVLRATVMKADGSTSEQSMPMAKLAPRMGVILAQAKATGDIDTYGEPAFTENAEGYRINAPRTSLRKCFDDISFYLQVKQIDTTWKITEHHSMSRTRSACTWTEAQLHERVQAVVRSVQDLVPVALSDEATVLAATADGSALTYTVKWTQILAAQLDLAAAMPALQSFAKKWVCSDAMVRDVVDHEGSVRFAFVDRVEAPITTVEVNAFICD